MMYSAYLAKIGPVPFSPPIIADATVQRDANAAWAATLAATTPTGRREEAYYILLDTRTDTFSHTAITIWPTVNDNTYGNMNNMPGRLTTPFHPGQSPRNRDVCCCLVPHTYTYPIHDIFGRRPLRWPVR